MYIDQIENKLNNHEASVNKVIAIILNTVVKNQALLETIIDCQLTIMHLIDKDANQNPMAKQMADEIQIKLARIQAEISFRL